MDEVRIWEEAHRRFHYALIERCGSPWLLRLVGILYDQSVRYRYVTLQAPGSLTGAQHAHEEIFEAVRRGDHQAAIQHLREHMQLTIDAIEELPSGDGEASVRGARDGR
jgi:DNA-binding GntR family transcriptional regulator